MGLSEVTRDGETRVLAARCPEINLTRYRRTEVNHVAKNLGMFTSCRALTVKPPRFHLGCSLEITSSSNNGLNGSHAVVVVVLTRQLFGTNLNVATIFWAHLRPARTPNPVKTRIVEPSKRNFVDLVCGHKVQVGHDGTPRYDLPCLRTVSTSEGRSARSRAPSSRRSEIAPRALSGSVLRPSIAGIHRDVHGERGFTLISVSSKIHRGSPAWRAALG